MLHLAGHVNGERACRLVSAAMSQWQIAPSGCVIQQPWGSLTIRSDASYTVTSEDNRIAVHDGRLCSEALSGRSEGDGSYIIFICPERPHAPLVIVADRLGTIPLYFGERGGRFVFASNLPTLMKAGFDEMDSIGATQMLLCGQPLGRRTLLKYVSLAPPAAEINVSPNATMSVRRYWRALPNPEHASLRESLIEDLLSRLLAAHSRTISEDCKLAMPVTGGLDSRLNLALRRDRLSSALLFHVRLARDPEGPIAKHIGHVLDQPVAELDMSPVRLATEIEDLASKETGELSAEQLWLAGVGRFVHARDASRILLDGYLQDALFNPRIVTECAHEQLANIVRMARNRWRFLGRSDEEPLLAEVLEEITADFGLATADSALAASQRYYLDNRSRRFVLSAVRLTQNHVPVATPALSTELIDFAMTLPWNARSGGPLYRALIMRLAPELGSVPYDKTGRPLKDGLRVTVGRRLTKTFHIGMNRLWPSRPLLRPPPSPMQLLLGTPQSVTYARQLLNQSRWARELTAMLAPGDVLLANYPGKPAIGSLLAALLAIADLERHQGRQLVVGK